MANVAFNPQLTSSPQNSFLLETEGYVQGGAWDDPSSRMYLMQGLVSTSVTQPVWGGMAIGELVNAVNTNATGPTIELAAANGDVTGFSVFNQAHNMIITPGATVPQTYSGMSVMFFRLGSNIRIPVQCDPALVLDGNLITQQVSWDFTNQKLIAYNSGIGALACKVLSTNSNSKIVSYNSGSGLVTWTTGTCALIQI